jgi:hypothetical protein
MLGLALCGFALLATYIAARRSLGAGLQALMIVGYMYGIGRGRYPDGLTHFTFDSSLVGLYFGYFSRKTSAALEHRSSTALQWTRVLMLWPGICMAYSPVFENSQPLTVQLVGLRAWTIMVPCLILGARIERADLDRLAPTIALLNCFALVIAGIEYKYGVDSVMPLNRATELIYASHDIMAGGETFNRIPGCFVHAAGYGTAMTLSIPFILHGLDGTRRVRIICMAGLAAGALGTFLCGQRTPVIILALASIFVALSMRARFGTLVGFLVVAAGIYYVVSHNERLQRFETLADTDYVQARVGNSVNTSFFDVLGKYPFGSGLAIAAGTSIPFFMQQLATGHIIGIENEYGRILCEQGVIGLLLWLGAIGWICTSTNAPPTMLPSGRAFGTALIFLYWLASLTGNGFLSAIPTTAMFFFLCGLRAASPAREATKLALRHVGTRRRSSGPTGTPARAMGAGRQTAQS